LNKEEVLMRESGYPEFDQHKEIHNAFRRKNGEFYLALCNGRTDALGEMVSFLSDWFLEHIVKCDRRYTAHFNQNGVY